MWRSTSVPRALGGAALAFCMLSGGPAIAQTAAGKSVDLSEVIVTAQRREQRNVEVPVSIVSQSAAQLQAAGITSTMNLGNLVPGLLMTRTGAPAAPSIRGISTKVASPGADANVSTYVDGFYQANAVALNRTLLDVANVEVLRGPQGTLFGRNSTGGAILITTRKPSHDPVFLASASVEENNGRKYVAYGSMGLTDNLAVSVSASYTKSDGWLRNRFPGPEFPTAPQRSNYFRVRALFEPTAKLSFDASYEHGMMMDGAGVAFTHVAHPLSAAFPILHDDPRETSLGSESRVKDIWDAGYLTASLDLGFGVLKSMTQVRQDRSPWTFDLDGSPIRAIQVQAVSPQKMQTQEVNLTSTGDGRLQWIVGGFYFHDKSAFRITTPAPNSYGAETTAWAGYADATYEVVDRLFLTVGVRYSEEKKRCLTVTPGGGATGALISCTDGNPIHREHATTPRANIRYQIDDNTSVYVSYSRGFKSGGFNDARASAPYNPEKLTDFEGGLKTARGPYQLELSAFHYKYKDLQFIYACTVVAPPFCTTNAGVFTTNAAEATSYGVESQFSWRASENLRFRGGVAYLHARYDSFLNASAAAPRTGSDTPPCTNPNSRLCPNVSVAQDWSGQRPIRSPKWSGNLGVTANLPTSVGAFRLDTNISYVSDYQVDTDSLPCITANCGRGLKPRRVIDAHTLVDATLSWRSLDEKLEVALYARNLFNKDYLLRSDASTVGDTVVGAEPRVVGVRLSYSYQ